MASTFSAQLASGITWAWEMENADIINCFWFSNAGWLDSELLEEAIMNAIENGRDGKGSLVVFAAGNFGNNGPSMIYPGNFDNRILTVGGVTQTGSRWFKSGYGDKLDVVAPGVGIWTTSPEQNIIEEEGTSFAAPHVSGIAALILSVNPCLSGQQVRDIIEQTSQKIRTDVYTYLTNPSRPNGSWNNQMGYGLADARAAVQMARNMLVQNPCEQGFQEPLQRSTLEIIAPNPVISFVNVHYNLVQANSASLAIASQTGNGSVNTFHLDLHTKETTINLSNYLPGIYTIALVVNGNVVDSKTLIKQ